jgi:hypothetical protein
METESESLHRPDLRIGVVEPRGLEPHMPGAGRSWLNLALTCWFFLAVCHT